MSPLHAENLQHVLATAQPLVRMGRVVKASGLIIEARMPLASVGDTCEIILNSGRRVHAEVVGVGEHTALLMPYTPVHGIHAGAEVLTLTDGASIPVGDQLLGRVVDASLMPMDGRGLSAAGERAPLQGRVPPAMQRRRIARVMRLGIRVLDAFLTCGEGQRIGIMAGPGVGKSVLLGMLARQSDADVNVVALVGERGREVREFVERDLGPAGLARSVIVVATGDEAPLMRVRAAQAATAVAEFFRSRGKRVLLMVDSLTRVAMAQREIGLAVGEPPTSKGYPPSVFALLPRLLERAGNDAGQGSITGIYTVLVEGDDLSDPVADSARSLLDGHVVLSRRLASSGHFPAVDVLASISRVMNDVVTPDHRTIARAGREVLAAYKEAADLVEVGAYVKGSNPRVDRALACIDAVNTFCRQEHAESAPLERTLSQLRTASSPPISNPRAAHA